MAVLSGLWWLDSGLNLIHFIQIALAYHIEDSETEKVSIVWRLSLSIIKDNFGHFYYVKRLGERRIRPPFTAGVNSHNFLTALKMPTFHITSRIKVMSSSDEFFDTE